MDRNRILCKRKIIENFADIYDILGEYMWSRLHWLHIKKDGNNIRRVTANAQM